MPTIVPETAASLDLQAQLLKMLVKAPISDAVGVACSLLLHCSYHHPDVLRRVLNEPVVREGFRGTSLLTVLSRAAHS